MEIEEIDDENEEQNAFAYALKYVKNKNFDDKTKRNLFANLMRKGYSYDLVSRVLNKINGEA